MADNPEPGLQGGLLPTGGAVLPVPYAQGVDAVGHNAIDSRVGNLMMTWSNTCAYVADGMAIADDGQLEAQPVGATSGVAIIDVSDISTPVLRGYLTDRGAINATETIDAVTLTDRQLLAASTYGGVAGMNGPDEGWLSLYDIGVCAQPELVAEFRWPEPVHTISFSPDGRWLFGTILNPFTGDGGIAVLDLADPAQPHFVGKFPATRADGSSFAFAPHALAFSSDGREVYVGVTTSQGADAGEFRNPAPGVPSPAAVGQDAGGVFVFDVSSIVRGDPDASLKLLQAIPGVGWHSPVRATIGGEGFLVNAGELGACPGAWPRIASIDTGDVVGEFRLAANRAENCPERTGLEQGTGGMVGRNGTAASHFNSVDDPEDTRLGLFSFMAAGLRIADLRDPANPREIAYFRPGDNCASPVRYHAETGTIWLACNVSGFWVLRLDSDLESELGLD